MSRKAALLILDGWGIGPDPERSAIAQADTPYVDQLLAANPNSTLTTFGSEVGLPDGQMGNSEVGHLNIGAGRIVYQELARINREVREGTLSQNEVLKEHLEMAHAKKQRVHLMGLLSDGGVHSHIDHLLALIDICDKKAIEQVFVHAFLDGRDTAPHGGAKYLSTLITHSKSKSASLATVIGRYYAMDRDKRWDRIKLAYDLLRHGKGAATDDAVNEVQNQYDQGITDEFMVPIVVDKEGVIQDGDLVICFNFRTDRPRQITEVLTQVNHPDHGMSICDIDYICMTEYDAQFKNVAVLFKKDNLRNTLGEIVSQEGLTQLRIAETEKYAHVTYFFSGGREEPFEGERRIVVPSPKVATYDLQPSMSAQEITDATIKEVVASAPDFICLNFANTDMVGHTGVFKAAIEATEKVDHCLSQLIPVLRANQYQIVIIADHGNSDYMINDDGSPHTAHTTNPVPCIVIADRRVEIGDGKLGDIAPTLCSLMEISPAEEMDGQSLIR